MHRGLVQLVLAVHRLKNNYAFPAKLHSTQDSMVVIEQNKSGFERPGDLEFEDYSQGINRASSDSSLGTPKGPLELLGKNKSKNFWLFSKRSKVGFHCIGVHPSRLVQLHG